MKVAVVGLGAIGITLAAAMQQTGRHEVVGCARRPRSGLSVAVAGAPPMALDIPVVSEPGALVAVDWVVVAVKAHQNPGITPWLERLCSGEVPVALVQNGVGHSSRLDGVVPADTVLPVIAWCTAEELTPGRVEVLPGQQRLDVPANPLGRSFAELFDASFIGVQALEDFVTAQWSKLIFNAVVGIEALTGRRAAVFRNPEVALMARSYAAECVRVAVAEGAALDSSYPDTVVDRLAAASPDHGNSMLYDRLAGRELEWEVRNGAISSLGARYGIATPVSDVLVALLKATSEAAGQ